MLKQFISLTAISAGFGYLVGALFFTRDDKEISISKNHGSIVDSSIGLTNLTDNESTDQLWRSIDPHNNGDPSLSASAVINGCLERKDMTPDMASDILYYAFDQDPEGIAQYLDKTLKAGGLKLLAKNAPLPSYNSAVFGKVFTSYAKAFGKMWEKTRIPTSLKRSRNYSELTIRKTTSELVRGGRESLMVAAALFPREVAKNDLALGEALDLAGSESNRLNLLFAKFSQPETDAALLASKCNTGSEILLMRLFDKPAPDSSAQSGIVAKEDVCTVIDCAGATEATYHLASQGSLGATEPVLKTEIIRRLCDTNIIAATRALADDPEPADQAILFAVEAMQADTEAALLWAQRIQDSALREKAYSIVGKLNK